MKLRNSAGAPVFSSSKAVRYAWLYFGAVMLGYAIVMFTTNLPPGFVDYPDWVYQGVLFQHVLTGHPVAGYALKHYPVPFSLTTLFLGTMDLMVSWQTAAKLWLCVYLALAGVATWMLSRALRVGSALLIISVPSMLIVNLEFWWGRVAFEVGMCLAMMLIALALEEASSWVLAAMLMLIYFAHMEACASAMLFLGLWILYTRRWQRIWVFVPTLALTFWYAAARLGNGNIDATEVPAATYAYGSKVYLLFKASTYFKILGYVNVCTADHLSQTETLVGKLGMILLLLLCVCITVLCLYEVVRGALARSRTAGYLTIFVLFHVGVSLLIPQIFLGSTDPGSRLVLMGVAIGLFLIDWRGPAAKAIATLSVIFCVVNLYQFAIVDHNPYISAHERDLPAAITTFAHVEPARTLVYYHHLEAGQMNLHIFETAMFRTTHEVPLQ
jgi:hypothetical protein